MTTTRLLLICPSPVALRCLSPGSDRTVACPPCRSILPITLCRRAEPVVRHPVHVEALAAVPDEHLHPVAVHLDEHVDLAAPECLAAFTIDSRAARTIDDSRLGQVAVADRDHLDRYAVRVLDLGRRLLRRPHERLVGVVSSSYSQDRSSRSCERASRATARGSLGLLLDQRQRLQHRVVQVRGHVGALLRPHPLRALGVQVPGQPVHPRPGDDADPDHGEQQRDQYVADHREPAVLHQEQGDRGAEQDQAHGDPDQRLPAALAEHQADDRDPDVPGPLAFWPSSACRQISARPVPANTSGQNIFPAMPSPATLQQQDQPDADDHQGGQLTAVLLPLPLLRLGDRRRRFVGAQPVPCVRGQPGRSRHGFRRERHQEPQRRIDQYAEAAEHRGRDQHQPYDRVRHAEVVRDPAGHTGDDPPLGTPVRPAGRLRGRLRRRSGRVRRTARTARSGLLVAHPRGVGGVRALVLTWALRSPALEAPLLLVLPRRRLGWGSVHGGPARRRGCWLAHHNDRHMWTGPTPAGLSPAASSTPARRAQGRLGDNPDLRATPGVLRGHPRCSRAGSCGTIDDMEQNQSGPAGFDRNRLQQPAELAAQQVRPAGSPGSAAASAAR